jgi:phosphatidylglycerophosphatase A
MEKKPRLVYNQEEMIQLNIEKLQSRGVDIHSIADIAFKQQSKYTKGVSMDLCEQSVLKLLSYRDIFHYIQLGIEIDRLAEQHAFSGPIQDIIEYDLGLFGADETIGLDIARNYGTIGQTNFGDIDVDKIGIVADLNEAGKKPGTCHTFLDDIVGALAAAASTRVAQIMNEAEANVDKAQLSIFDLKDIYAKTTRKKK